MIGAGFILVLFLLMMFTYHRESADWQTRYDELFAVMFPEEEKPDERQGTP